MPAQQKQQIELTVYNSAQSNYCTQNIRLQIHKHEKTEMKDFVASCPRVRAHGARESQAPCGFGGCKWVRD